MIDRCHGDLTTWFNGIRMMTNDSCNRTTDKQTDRRTDTQTHTQTAKVSHFTRPQCEQSVIRDIWLIYCLSVYLLEMVTQHCPVGFLGRMYKRLWTIYALWEVFFLYVFFVLFFSFLCVCFALFFVYLGTIYIINKIEHVEAAVNYKPHNNQHHPAPLCRLCDSDTVTTYYLS